MKKTLLFAIACLFSFLSIYAEKDDTASATTSVDTTLLTTDEIESAMVYQTGKVDLEEGNATLDVPKGFRYLDRKQSMYVLSTLWGNPPDSTVLGLLMPEDKGVLSQGTWAFEISFDPMGYVKDDDADDINYDDLLKDLQKEATEANPERIKQGYPPFEVIGWASHPFYDKNKKILHWAKEIKFGTDSIHTLNYNLRVLGRKGVFMLNAIATIDQLGDVQKNIGKVINSVEFKAGSKYVDFKPDIDKVATWTIGGLVAGKILAKVGFFVVLAKFGKVILLGLAGAGAAVWKFFTGKKNKNDNSSTEEPEKLA